MEHNTLIFCVSHNCSPITRVMLQSFYKHHPKKKIVIVGTQQDFAELEEEGIHSNAILVDISDNADVLAKFKIGHGGTTQVFAMVLSRMIGMDYDSFIHIDSDVYFKRESVSLIEEAFEEGYDIVGSRRCYKNNPSGVSGLDNFPDSISTYFFGMKLEKIPTYPFDRLCRYCEGAEHPLGWLVLDAFDGVVHGTMNNGGNVKYIDWNIIGSQDINGKKNNNYTANLHMDCGSHLIHMGGVGSGYAYFNKRSNPQESYAKWAVGRWSLFSRLFYQNDIGHTEPTVYGSDGRWINGNYDENIMNNLLIDMEN